MNSFELDPRLSSEVKAAIDKGMASGELLSASQIEQQTAVFRSYFGPAILRGTDGEALLRLMHGRQEAERRCLAYWLEFKDDDEFPGHRYGRIGGGSALKFGIFQRQKDGTWIVGSSQDQRPLDLDEAIHFARKQRDELLAGAEVLAGIDVADVSDEAYKRLQSAMEKAAPELADASWAHKYWFLCHPDRLDDFHSPQYQRFHLFKLLQLPPDGEGIGGRGRFVCAGRFVSAARALDAPVSELSRILNRRHGVPHRYWKIGTTEGGTGISRWEEMRDGGFVSLGWKEQVPDLSETLALGRSEAKETVKTQILPLYPTNPGVASRKAGEILNLAREMAERDIVLATEGQTVLGIGRITGPYEYDARLAFPHKRPVEWLNVEQWKLSELEGPRTTVFELGRDAQNLLDIENRIFHAPPTTQMPRIRVASETKPHLVPALDPFSARVESILRRKGQLIFFGPPGTGKTYRALAAAHELAARQAFKKTFRDLSQAELTRLTANDGLVRVCTFHPGWGYEDFMEGLRPTTSSAGQLLFERRDGIFKTLCADARKTPDANFYLIIDEINRGDLPRIFGELLTAIEFDKREKAFKLPSGATFSVPRNVYILGAMNTADRSISLLDAALRRRFGFVELMPDSSLLRGHKAGGVALGPWLDALNSRLRRHLKRDARNLQVGHAYLMPTVPIASSAEFIRILRDDIFPLLQEYCYEDFPTLKEILGSGVVDVAEARIRDELFEPEREDELMQAITFEEIQSLPAALETDTSAGGEEASLDDDNEAADGIHQPN